MEPIIATWIGETGNQADRTNVEMIFCDDLGRRYRAEFTIRSIYDRRLSTIVRALVPIKDNGLRRIPVTTA